MTNEPEWRDANSETSDLPGKGRAVILCVLGGIVLGALSIIGMRVKPLGLAVGGFAFFSGIGMLLRARKNKANAKLAVIVTIAGFFMMLAHPRFGIAAAFAGYFLVTGAIVLVVFGLIKAVTLAWNLGNRS